MNRARLSQMTGLGNSIRAKVYDCSPLGCEAGRQRAWSNLAEIDLMAGSTSMSQIKAASAGWIDDGVQTNTIASTWDDRVALTNVPVGFDNLFMTKALPDISNISRYCYEVRDSPDAPDHLVACLHNCNDCGTHDFLEDWVGQNVALRGVLKSYYFGYGISVALSYTPHAPNQ